MLSKLASKMDIYTCTEDANRKILQKHLLPDLVLLMKEGLKLWGIRYHIQGYLDITKSDFYIIINFSLKLNI